MATFDVTPSLSSELSPAYFLSSLTRSAHPFINSVYVFVSPTELWAPWGRRLCPSHWLQAHNICLLNKWKQIYIIDLNKWMNTWNEHFLFIWLSSQCWERLRARGEGGDRGWDNRIASLTQSINMSLSKLWELLKDREAWHAEVHGVAKSRTWLGNWTTSQSFKVISTCYRRRQWHPTPVLLPRKSHRRRSLVGCSPWGH